MASTMVSAGNLIQAQSADAGIKAEIYKGIVLLSQWLENNDYRAYDTFDGLNAKYLRPLTFENPFLRTVLLQGVRRFPINLRPLLGIRKERSTKGMGFLVRGFIRLHKATGNRSWAAKAESALQWLIDHKARGYHGACWGNHFDYQSRTFYLPKGTPTIVWTSLIGHAFLDAYENFQKESYLRTAIEACEHILFDIEKKDDEKDLCISYIPGKLSLVHNANTLGASLLARTYSHTKDERLEALSQKAMQYTAKYQRADGSWYYGEKQNLHWVDNFHTAYVLDCFRHYEKSMKDERFVSNMLRGYEYWKNNFFLADGTPRYYNNKTLPLDIQCSSQAIDTLVFFRDKDSGALDLAKKVAKLTFEQMQDSSGYFYYRRYSRWVVNKTPTLHWAQATMLSALAGLYEAI